MIDIRVQCLTCNKPVDKMTTERNVFRRATTVDVWCHGKHQTLEVTTDAVLALSYDEIKLSAFHKPVPVIEDRDRGDEDPNEPWEGKSCQF